MPKVTAAPPRGSSNKSSRMPIIVIGTAIAAALIVAVVVTQVVGGKDNADDTVAQTRPVTVSGAALPALTDAAVDSAVGRAAPGLDGTSFDGAAVRIANDGRPKIVIFVAHWCPHCQAEVPVITAWLAANGMPDGVDLYSVSTGVSKDRPNYPPSAWLTKQGWPIPVMADSDDDTAAAAFGLNAYPFFNVINARGTIAQRTTGELTTAQFAQLVAVAKT